MIRKRNFGSRVFCRPSRFPKSLSAFSLVEVTIALGVAAFSLVAILGLFHVTLSTEKSTVGKTVASGILSEVFSDLSATPNSAQASRDYAIAFNNSSVDTPQTLYFTESGKATGPIGSVPTGESLYRVSIGIPPSTAPAPTVLHILVTWPAAADPDPSRWPARVSESVEVVTALDRN